MLISFDVDANDWITGGVYIQYNNRLVVRGALEEGRTDKRSGGRLRRDLAFHQSITRSTIGHPAPTEMN
jgi:hypothetical protein